LVGQIDCSSYSQLDQPTAALICKVGIVFALFAFSIAHRVLNYVNPTAVIGGANWRSKLVILQDGGADWRDATLWSSW